MKIIGLTGPSGAGKGEVAAFLCEYGIPHINCDSIYHSLLTPNTDCTYEIIKEFGLCVMADDGSVDRKKLAAIVFGDEKNKELLNTLNKITHKYVLIECRKLIEMYEGEGKKAVTIDAPTLFESGFDKECDIILVVTAPEAVRLGRIEERDSLGHEKAQQRINAQPTDDFYTQKADFVIVNDSDKGRLKEKVGEFINTFFREIKK